MRISTLLLALLLPIGLEAQTKNIFLTAEEIAKLPTSGKAWDKMKSEADSAPATPDLGNQDESENSRTLARAMIFVRTGTTSYRDKVIATLKQVPGTEAGGRTLALGRKLGAYICAADLLGYRDAAWVNFVTSVATETLDGSTLVAKSEDKANNWSSSCIWSRTARAAYLGKLDELDRCASVFRGMVAVHDGWLSPKTGKQVAGFTFPKSAFGELIWQADPTHPEAIQGPAAAIQGHPMSGSLPEELRRASLSFRWPPPCENYVWSALEGYLGTAWLLAHNGYPAFEWSDKAILRAFTWQHAQANCPATGDDTHQPWIVNAVYSSNFPAPLPSTHGKLYGFGDWWAARSVSPPPPPPPSDFRADYEFHFDPATNKWTAHRLNDGETASGTGATTADALRDWLTRNPGEP